MNAISLLEYLEPLTAPIDRSVTFGHWIIFWMLSDLFSLMSWRVAIQLQTDLVSNAMMKVWSAYSHFS
ncbi:hypothetical protein C3F36_02730 [Aeromonas sp. ASNIH2]|nr:hypothetical protein C3F36_02730 [Aeromonas sp. ASNIH2]